MKIRADPPTPKAHGHGASRSTLAVDPLRSTCAADGPMRLARSKRLKGEVMQRRPLILLLALTLVAGTVFSTASVAKRRGRHDPQLIRALGALTFEPNALIQATFRFSPERSFPHTGDKVRLLDDDRGDEPHTLTIVRRSQLPTSPDEVFACDACNAALEEHFAQDPPILRVNVGAPGLDQPGDSLWLAPDASISSVVSAPAGTLHFLCAIHPWMQGRLVVGSA